MRSTNRLMPRLAWRLLALVGASVLGATLLVPSAAHAAPPFRFVPVELICYTTEDFHGADGAYIRADARVYWPHNGVVYMNAGSIHQFAASYALGFHTDIKLDLYDQDRGIWDDDDHLGTIWISSADADSAPGPNDNPDTPQREIMKLFLSDDVFYALFYFVERI